MNTDMDKEGEPADTNSNEIKLNDIMFKALDHAVFSIEDNNETLIPFSLTEDFSGNRTLTRSVADRIEVGVEGKKKIEALKEVIHRYALAYDGYPPCKQAVPLLISLPQIRQELRPVAVDSAIGWSEPSTPTRKV